MLKKIISLTNLTLLTALSLSTVAAYYSIMGLTAIFAGAVIPIIIMGSILEVGKIVTTVWLRKYWNRCSWVLKLYLVPAVVLLALLTSMGIFGFLSKAHMDQGIVSGDSQAKLALYDEKIKTQRDNIELARKALQQMDAQVDARLSRGDSENGAERAVAIRRQQATERTKLQKEIGDAQKEIAKLNEERAPIAAENRKVEAEVGPVKYIAALIYGDKTDQSMLEAAVRWVIILLVVVFDPLAIALVLAANASRDWDNDNDVPKVENELEEIDKIVEEAAIETFKEVEESENKSDDFDISKHSYLNKPFVHFTNLKPMVAKFIDPKPEVKEKKQKQKKTKQKEPVQQEVSEPVKPKIEIITEGVTELNTDSNTKLNNDLGDYVLHQGKLVRKDALRQLDPRLSIAIDNQKKSNSQFGSKFPEVADKGDMFVRVDTLPNRVFKFDGKRWIEINKENTDTYLHDKEYIKHLVTMIDKGQYDVDLLSPNEQREVENYLRNQNT